MKTALHTVSYAGVWPGQATLPLERIVDKAADLGYDGVMLVAKRPHASPLDMDADRRARLRDQIRGRGLELAALAGYTDFGVGYDVPGIPLREMQILFLPRPASIRAVAPGDGFIDYRSFFAALRAGGYDSWVAYEMCAPLEGGGSEVNLDRCARRFLEWLPGVWGGGR